MIRNDDLDYEGQENPETEVIIDPIINTKHSIIYGLYSQLSILANFYSRIQNSYKSVASTWLVSTLIGVGYLFSQRESNLPISPYLILIFVFFVSMWGITLIWFLDIYVYQTDFYKVVIEEVKLEKKHKWLSSVNDNISKIQSNPRKRISQSIFYIGCHYILLFLMCLIFLFLVNYQILQSVFIVLGFIGLGWVITIVMLGFEFPKKTPFVKGELKKINGQDYLKKRS